MKFQHYELNNLQGGEIIEVTLSGNSANVKLLNYNNFQYYKTGKKHEYYGGHITRSPFRITVPNSGHWFVTIDLGGYKGNVSSSVRIL
ncbi:DUF1883 domain-containing protein [Flavobacterium sp.]|uniref:DUF1883 domain-containing protein n=1 Tax=Flavobacterium sp. TaxID=239 RepID=UPI00286E1F84|nr:DUF1883 domain-containing protein [Flavobacterium sp.]